MSESLYERSYFESSSDGIFVRNLCTESLPSDAPSLESWDQTGYVPIFTDCPHVLEQAKAKDDLWFCSECNCNVQRGATVHTCEDCNYDLCSKCFVSVGTAEARRKLCDTGSIPVDINLTDETGVIRFDALSLGIEAHVRSQGGLAVGRVSDDGPIALWNRENPGFRISKGDVIVSSNGHALYGEAKPFVYAVDGRLRLRILKRGAVNRF